MKKVIFTILLAGIFSTSVNNVFSAGSLNGQNITAVAFHSTGFFMYASGWINPNSCSNSDAIVLLDSDPNYDKAYALLLSAYMSGKSVSGYSNGCTTWDGRTYNTIRGYKYLKVQ